MTKGFVPVQVVMQTFSFDFSASFIYLFCFQLHYLFCLSIPEKVYKNRGGTTAVNTALRYLFASVVTGVMERKGVWWERDDFCCCIVGVFKKSSCKFLYV